jgi:hypothetical protein
MQKKMRSAAVASRRTSAFVLHCGHSISGAEGSLARVPLQVIRAEAAALQYARGGWTVFPACASVKKSHKCADRSNGAKWGATSDPAEIRRDFSRWPNARIGVPTGKINGIVVIETDTVAGHGVDGSIALRELEAKYRALPVTLQAISPSGSVHHYLKHPGGSIKIKTTASELGDGVDVRGDGGMVIAPPSINPDGRAYRWLNSLPVAPMPTWLVELTRDKPRTISERAVAEIARPCSASNAYGTAALEAEIAVLANAAPGTRNHTLNRCGFRLYQLVAGGELDDGLVRHRLIDASFRNGLAKDDGMHSVLKTIESARNAGLQFPRSRSA